MAVKSFSELQNVRDAIEVALWQTSFVADVMTSIIVADNKSGMHIQVEIAESVIPENLPKALEETIKMYRGDSSMVGWSHPISGDPEILECFLTWETVPGEKPKHGGLRVIELINKLGQFNPMSPVVVISPEMLTLEPGEEGAAITELDLDPVDDVVMMWIE